MNKTLWGKQILTESLRTLVKNRNIHCTFFEPSRANDCCTTSSRRHCWWRCWRINVWFSFAWRWRYQTDARRWGRDQRSLLQRSISVWKDFRIAAKYGGAATVFLYTILSSIFSQLKDAELYWRVLGVVASGHCEVRGVDSIVQRMRFAVTEYILKVTLSDPLIGGDDGLWRLRRQIRSFYRDIFIPMYCIFGSAPTLPPKSKLTHLSIGLWLLMTCVSWVLGFGSLPTIRARSNY